MLSLKLLGLEIFISLLLNLTAALFDKPLVAAITPWGWLLVLLHATYILLSVKQVAGGAIAIRSLFGRHTVVSYAVAALIFAAVGLVYWRGINAGYSRLLAESKPPTPPSSAQPALVPAPQQPTGPATTFGDNSPAVTGSGNKIVYDAPVDKKPQRKAKK